MGGERGLDGSAVRVKRSAARLGGWPGYYPSMAFSPRGFLRGEKVPTGG